MFQIEWGGESIIIVYQIIGRKKIEAYDQWIRISFITSQDLKIENENHLL